MALKCHVSEPKCTGGNVKIAVLIKRVPDTASELRVGDDGKSVNTGNCKYVMSPYDEHAVELAIKLKETNGAEVVVVSVGPPETKEVIRQALAMGADEGVLIGAGSAQNLTSNGVSKLLAAHLSKSPADIILAGKQAVDDDAAQVPERVAELLGLPHASVITKFELNGTSVTVDREIEGGSYTLELPLPAVLTTQKGINTPRYPTLPNIMKAKKKEIKEVAPDGLGVDDNALSGRLFTESIYLPRQQRLGKVLAGDNVQRVKELVKILTEDEKVL
jgi:electron transfer flavoprotein beta subunit